MIPDFLPGDLIVTPGNWAVRLCQQFPGEPKTWAGHIAGMATPLWVSEALLTVTNTPLDLWDAKHPEYEVWRNINWTRDQREAVGRGLLESTGKLYGGLKLGAMFTDWLLSWGLAVATLGMVKTEVRLARLPLSWLRLDDVPICSYHYGVEARQGANYEAWGPPRQLSPDDMHDYVKTHPGEWALIYKKGGPSSPA
uniref:Uncharacterized protein n=1 Tax=viral metagenome TaxID=1070528 RepID=A0A6H1ZE20_9ZZZZ